MSAKRKRRSSRCAVCLDGKNARPPEDCGGIFGYYDLLKAINNPKHAEHQQLLDWLGGPLVRAAIGRTGRLSERVSWCLRSRRKKQAYSFLGYDFGFDG